MTSDDTAKRRFLTIQAMRWGGLALVVFALMIVNRRIDLPIAAGYVLFVVGIVDALVMPSVLARRWKSPPP